MIIGKDDFHGAIGGFINHERGLDLFGPFWRGGIENIMIQLFSGFIGELFFE